MTAEPTARAAQALRGMALCPADEAQLAAEPWAEAE